MSGAGPPPGSTHARTSAAERAGRVPGGVRSWAPCGAVPAGATPLCTGTETLPNGRRRRGREAARVIRSRRVEARAAARRRATDRSAAKGGGPCRSRERRNAYLCVTAGLASLCVNAATTDYHRVLMGRRQAAPRHNVITGLLHHRCLVQPEARAQVFHPALDDAVRRFQPRGFGQLTERGPCHRSQPVTSDVARRCYCRP